MSQNDIFKIETCVLKVNIHCHGCEQKVTKLLQKIDGVYSVRVDAEEGKVLVAGDVDPPKLVKKLKRGGKHAEIWGAHKGMMHNHNYPIKPHFHNDMQIDNAKLGKDNNHKATQKPQLAQLSHLPNINKGLQDFKVPPPPKEHKSVKFNLPEDEFDATDDDYLDGHGHPLNHNKMMPIMGYAHQPHAMMNKDNSGGSKNNASLNKADVTDQPMLFKGKAGNDNINRGKKSNQKGKNKNEGGGGDDNNKKNNGRSEGGGVLGRFLGFGNKSNKGGLQVPTCTTNKTKNQDKASNNDFDFHDYDDTRHTLTPPHPKSGKVSNNAKEGQMGQRPITMPHHHKHKDKIPPKQGLPAMNADGGYYQGMQTQQQQQQQHYLGMMMNQNQNQNQQPDINNMYPTSIMHGRPHPSMNYMPPPPMPSHPMADPITHTFSDENVESCTII